MQMLINEPSFSTRGVIKEAFYGVMAIVGSVLVALLLSGKYGAALGAVVMGEWCGPLYSFILASACPLIYLASRRLNLPALMTLFATISISTSVLCVISFVWNHEWQLAVAELMSIFAVLGFCVLYDKQRKHKEASWWPAIVTYVLVAVFCFSMARLVLPDFVIGASLQ